jgi:hypothetical protein
VQLPVYRRAPGGQSHAAGRPASYGAAVVNINSKAAARKKVREAQMKANQARLKRERHNVDDAASFLVELGRVGAVDEWEHSSRPMPMCSRTTIARLPSSQLRFSSAPIASLNQMTRPANVHKSVHEPHENGPGVISGGFDW